MNLIPKSAGTNIVVGLGVGGKESVCFFLSFQLKAVSFCYYTSSLLGNSKRCLSMAGGSFLRDDQRNEKKSNGNEHL